MASPEDGHQLSLPLPPQVTDPHVADSLTGFPMLQRSTAHKLPGELTDAELLAIVLGRATAPLCERLTAGYDSFRELALAPAAEIVAHGFTTGVTDRLSAVFEIAKRYGEREWKIGEPFRGPVDIYAHFREHLAAETCEHFYAVFLDNKLRKIREALVSKGSLTSSIVHPRDVFGQVVRYSAAAVVFVHNHSSGDATPSKEDIEITNRLREVGNIMGVKVLDHIIIGKGRFVSFVDDGYW